MLELAFALVSCLCGAVAPAVLIGQWASKAGAVAKKLPKRAVAA